MYRLRNTVQHYAWGSRTAIPELLGERSPADEPCAELWMGAHPKAPSQVLLPEGPIGLDRFVAEDPEAVLGAAVAKRFDGVLPFLLKVLAADAPLSIQAHPDAEQAREGFARENAAGVPLDAPNRSYPDPRHKPELVFALTPFRALNRFREPAEIEARIEALGVAGLAKMVSPLRRSPDRRGLAAFFEAWMTLTEALRSEWLEEVKRAAAGASGDPVLDEVMRLAQRYPADPGVLAPLLLNLVELAPGEAMYLPAGELHSYLGGVAIEIMASSDNVLRGGLTPKHVDVPELLRTLNFENGPVEVLTARPGARGEACYQTPAEEFALARIEVAPRSAFCAAPERGSEILLCTSGAGRIEADPAHGFERGSSFVVPAAASAYRIEGEATLYRATTNC